MEIQNECPTTAAPDYSLIGLVRELRDETTTLVRQEIALAKAETCEKASRMTRNIAYIGAGSALAYTALVFMLLGVRDFLVQALVTTGLNPVASSALASFFVAVIIGVVGWSLIAKGKKALSKEGLAPQKSIQSLKENQRFIEDKLARI